jgi:hypothetical protein
MRRADEVKRRGPSSFARPRQIALAIGQIGHVSKQFKKDSLQYTGNSRLQGRRSKAEANCYRSELINSGCEIHPE